MDIYRELLSSLVVIVVDVDPRAQCANWIDSIHPEDRSLVVDACALAADRRERRRVEFRATADDGRTQWRALTVQPLFDNGGGCRLIAALVDVTAQREPRDRDTTRRRAEAALAERERIYQSTFDGALIGIAHTSPDGRFIVVNRRLCTLLGYTQEEFTAMNFAAISHPDEVGQDLDARTRLLEGAIESYSREKRYRRKDGTYFWANLTVSVHRELSGEPAHFIAVIEDLTQRKLLEQQARQAHKMEAIGRLAGGIAHDFNNLLTAIVGFADLTLKQLDAADAARHDVEEIYAAGTSAAALTQQLLAFSRQQILEPHVVDLNGVVSRMRPLLSRLIGEHIELQWRLPTPLDPVFADPGQLEQVVLNLALNARDAMPEGGTLTIETADAAFDGTHVMLAISDTGIGMDERTKEHLFEPFYTTKEVGKGTGLGLATVYGIVKQSGGAIRVYSEAGLGTTIKILLPRAERTEEVVTPTQPPAAMPQGSETVLVVEDQREVLSVTAETLRRHGYDVLEAANGDDALDAASARSRIDLLLTDAVMPRMSGRELAERLLRRQPSACVLYMSGYTDSGVERRELVDPCAAFIQKPFAPNVLLQKVREVLDEHAPPPLGHRGQP